MEKKILWCKISFISYSNNPTIQLKYIIIIKKNIILKNNKCQTNDELRKSNEETKKIILSMFYNKKKTITDDKLKIFFSIYHLYVTIVHLLSRTLKDTTYTSFNDIIVKRL